FDLNIPQLTYRPTLHRCTHKKPAHEHKLRSRGCDSGVGEQLRRADLDTIVDHEDLLVDMVQPLLRQERRRAPLDGAVFIAQLADCPPHCSNGEFGSALDQLQYVLGEGPTRATCFGAD